MNVSSILFAALALLSATSFAQAASPAQPGKPQNLPSPDETPKGLAKSDWSSIRAAYEAGRHAFKPIEGGWQARNPGQQWTTKFDGRGFIAEPRGGGWQWGLELQSYGFGESQQSISGTPEVQAAGQRLTYQRDANVQEWFVNDQRGLEHGFTIARRPDRSDPSDQSDLAFLLKTRGSLRPQVTADAQGVHFQDTTGTTVLNYTGLKVWDADGKILPARFEPAGLSGFLLLVDEATARYPITIDPIAQQAYLKASNSGAGDQFGCSVAISGDTAVVGAYAEASNASGVNGDQADNSLVQAGAAYIFTRSAGGAWSQQAYLKASSPDGYGVFGYSVAISGDTVIIGAYGDYLNPSGVIGAAYVFTRSAGIWTQQAELRASNLDQYDSFGSSVSISGDTAVIGSPGEDSSFTGVGGNQANNSALNSGAAYIFTRSAGVWSQQAYLKPSNTGANDNFGITVAISGDTAVVGANGEDSSATGVGGNQANNDALNSGAAYIFTRSAGVWTQQAYLKASNSRAYNPFGNSVAVSGDTAVIGASYEDSNATGVNGDETNSSSYRSGAAYVFIRSGGVWTQQAYLKASNTGSDDQFGHAVAVAGDTAVIGSRGEDSNATGVGGNQSNNSASDSGAAYVFTRSAGNWTQQAYLKASNAGAGDRFGQSVAVAGDTFVIAATSEDSTAITVDGNQTDNSASDAGAAYTFTGLGLPPAPTVTASTANLVTNATTLTITGTGFDAATPGNNTVALTPAGTGTVTAATATTLTVGVSGLTLGALNAVVTTNGQSSGAAVQVATVVTAAQSWRQTYFGSTANSGNGADTFDFDKDGLVNLIEWACGLNPTTSSDLPTPVQVVGGNIEFTYPRAVSALNAGAVFTVEWSDTLPGTTWSTAGVTQQTLSTSNGVDQVKATLPAGSAGRRFVHLKVTPAS